MTPRYAIGLPTVGEFGDIRTLVDLAETAERAGWDGVHLWDHLLYHQPGWPVASSTVAASAIAMATSRLRIILTQSLPRRQVQDVALDTAGIDALSGRRLTIVATLGSLDREYTDFGLDPDLRVRGRGLDERLDRLTELWDQWQVPRVPIWAAAGWPRTVGFRRATRLDGVMPTFEGQRERNVAPEDFATAAALVPAGHDVALEGATAAGGERPDYPGMTWWIEALGWWRGGVAAARDRIAAGPPQNPSIG